MVLGGVAQELVAAGSEHAQPGVARPRQRQDRLGQRRGQKAGSDGFVEQPLLQALGAELGLVVGKVERGADGERAPDLEGGGVE